MAYGDFKDLPRKTASDKILRDKAFNIATNPKYDRYQRVLASIVYKYFYKKTAGGAVKNEIKPNKELAEELHKPFTREFEKQNVHPSFIDNIWDSDLADMQFMSKFNKVIRFLLCGIDIFRKYPWVISLKDKKGITITNAFQKIFDESNCKPNEIWVDKDSEFYNKSMKSWLQDNTTEMFSTHNEGKFVKTSIGIVKNKIYKYIIQYEKTCISVN